MSARRYAHRTGCRCGWVGFADALLSAPNPFLLDETIEACPECMDHAELFRACDIPGCTREACMGVKVEYVTTCSDHAPRGET
jgi:hypothetical protein